MSSRRNFVVFCAFACALAGLALWFVRGRDAASTDPSRGAIAQVVDSTSSATQPPIDSLRDDRTRETVAGARPLAPFDVGPAFGAEFVLLCSDELDGAPLMNVVAWVWEPDAQVWALARSRGEHAAEEVSAEHVRARGTRVVADEAGCIRLPRSKNARAVVAEHGDRAAMVRIEPDEPSPRSLVLTPRVRLGVHVRDAIGTPSEGVEVVLRGPQWVKDLGRARTDASGNCALDVAVDARPGDDVVRVIVLAPESVEKRVRVGVAGTQTIEFVLPRAESWNVTLVDGGGDIVPLWGTLSIGRGVDDIARPTGVGFPQSVDIGLANGRARMAAPPPGVETYVGLGVDAAHWWIAPSHTGDVRLAADDIRELLSLTLCDTDGSPAANRSFMHWFDGFETNFTFDGGGALRTDERGRAAIALGKAIPDGGRLVVCDDSEPLRFAFVDCAALRSAPGPRVVLATTELALTGRIVDTAGAPLVAADIWVSTPDAAGHDRTGYATARTDANGRFRAFGFPSTQRELSISVSRTCDLALQSGSPVRRWGERDVELRVDTLGSIEGEVFLDRGASEALLVEARWPAGSSNARRGAERARTWRSGDRLHFRFADLEAGERDLVFTHAAWDARRIDVAGVRVEAGATTRDPRTAPLDLRGAFDAERDPGLSPLVSFVDAQGAPIAEGLISCETDTDRWGGLRSWMDGAARLPLRYARCAAYAPGFAIHVGDVPRTQPATWVLEPEPTIVVELATPAPLRELVRAVRVEIDLEHGPFNITARQEIAATLVDGRATFACLMGGLHVVDISALWVAAGEEHWTRVSDTTIEVSEGARGELHILKADVGAWEAALRTDGAPIPPR